MKIYVLSSQQCEDSGKNNGDCFVIDNSKEIVIYDCGCEEYADTKRIIPISSTKLIKVIINNLA